MSRPSRLFLDLDGVFADFNTGILRLTGKAPDDHDEISMWRHAAAHEGFYANLPLMPEAPALWAHCQPYNPTFITGCPSSFKDRAAADKRLFVQTQFGDVPVITCASKDKCLHMQPGDVLVDDWTRWAHLWINKGGIFIHHVNLDQTLSELTKHGFPAHAETL